MKSFIKEKIRKFGYDIVGYRTYKGMADPIMPWETDTEFLNIYNSIVGLTLADRKRLYILWQFCKKAELLTGDIAECGVYKGGTALLLAKAKTDEKKLYLFDTFSGMPEADPSKDDHVAGDLNDTSLETVKMLFKEQKNISFRPGFFPDTAKGLENEFFCLVHCDMDIYSSIMDCCIFFYPRLVNGGMIIFDDYGAASCPGAKEAVNDFCKKEGIYELYLPTGQAIVLKY
jgi:O-methyltransferase